MWREHKPDDEQEDDPCRDGASATRLSDLRSPLYVPRPLFLLFYDDNHLYHSLFTLRPPSIRCRTRATLF